MGFIQRHLPIIVALLAGLLAILGVWGFVQTQRELPARDLTILADEEGSGHYQVAERYKALLAARGLDLHVQATAGAQETLRLLRAGQAGIALLPGILTAEVDPLTYSSLGALFDEPLWIFYDRNAFAGEPVRYLEQLKGKRVAVGVSGSGSHALAVQLLGDSGVIPANTSLLEMSQQEATEGMLAGKLDAMLLLDAYQSEAVQILLRAPDIGLADLAQAKAYVARQNALKIVELPEGIVDLQANIPAEDVQLLASVANLVIRRDLNSTLGRSLITAALLLHSAGDYFAPPYTYPNMAATDLPVQPEYVSYFNHLKGGGVQITSKLPFWVAYTVEQFIFYLLPFLILTLLLVAYSPALWRFYMRGKLLPIYKVLRRVEIDLPQMNIREIDAAIERLSTLEANVTQRVRVSATYLPEVFHLRSHIRSVIADLLTHRRKMESGQAVDIDHPGHAQKNVRHMERST